MGVDQKPTGFKEALWIYIGVNVARFLVQMAEQMENAENGAKTERVVLLVYLNIWGRGRVAFPFGLAPRLSQSLDMGLSYKGFNTLSP